MRARRERLVWRTVRIALISRRSLRDPRVDPAPVGLELGLTGTAQADTAAGAAAAAGPPACRDSASPQPRSRGRRYCSWASSTCALPSLLFACWAKMSRISAVRSTTLTLVCCSRLRSWDGRQLAVADDRVGAGGDDHVAQLVDLAAADERGRVGPAAPLDEALEHLRTGGLGQRGELGQRVLGVGDAALGPHADQHDPLEPQLAVLDLGDVGEFGGEAGDAPQRMPLLELQLAGGDVVGRTVPVVFAKG